MIVDGVAISRAADVAWVASPDRVVILRLANVATPPLVLAGTAGTIWEKIEGEMTLDELVASVSTHFSVDGSEIYDAVAAFVTESIERGLMRTRQLGC